MRKHRRRNPIQLGGSGVAALAVIGAAGFVGYLLYKNRAAIAAAFNPFATTNLAYQGSTKILQSVTGNKVDSVGTAVANVFPSAAEQKVNAMFAQIAPYVPPDMTNSSYYDLGQKLPTISTSDGTITGWLSSLFKSDAEKKVDAMYTNGLGEVRSRRRKTSRHIN